MLTSSTLQHSFDISVVVQAACDLLAANWVVIRATAFARSDCTGVPFELSGWNFQRLSRIDWKTKWRWQQFFCNYSSRIRWQLRIISDQTMYSYRSHGDMFSKRMLFYIKKFSSKAQIIRKILKTKVGDLKIFHFHLYQIRIRWIRKLFDAHHTSTVREKKKCNIHAPKNLPTPTEA